MYSYRKGLLFGFHGCDLAIRDEIVFKEGKILKLSENDYDWLGPGCYFWENNEQRALDFATHLRDNPPPKKGRTIHTPAVLGAVIDLGLCFDLLDSRYLDYLAIAYNALLKSHRLNGTELAENSPGFKEDKDLVKRKLDCSVVQYAISLLEKEEHIKFDSVRGVFFEGDELYPTAGFKTKNHIQIAIRNHNCIKGYFIPRYIDSTFKKI